MFQAVLSNPDHPDYGVVTIPFPSPVFALVGRFVASQERGRVRIAAPEI